MRDDLGDRMKRDYESRTRYMLPRRTWTLIPPYYIESEKALI